MKVAIIGAGIGGLSTAALLAANGDEVHVFEKNAGFGGKLNILERGNYRFDTGPSLFTMPYILEKLYQKLGTTLHDELLLRTLSPLCRYFYHDGTQFDCFDDQPKTLHQIREIAPEDESAFSEFLAYSENIYNKTAKAFIFNPLYEFQDFRNLDVLSFFGIDAFTTVSDRVDSKFKSEYLRKFFKRFTTYNGSSPFLAPATLNVIPHVEINQGGFYIDGGLFKLAENLHNLALKAGVHFHFNANVQQIKADKFRAKGLLVKNEFFESDIVVSNSDATETMVHLLHTDVVSAAKKRKTALIEPSSSGFVLLLGIDTQYPQLVHHNLFFSDDYEREFQQIFNDRIMPGDPSIYIVNTSFTNPEHAPNGGSNLFILVNAPYLSFSYNWDEQAKNYASKIVHLLEKHGLTNLEKHIRLQEIITPKDFYDRYASNKGSIYGTSSNSKFAAFARPRNKYRGLKGLYLVGGSTHPGGGIPLVIQSALNAVELIHRHEKQV